VAATIHSPKPTCDSCGAAVSPKDTFCQTCGSDLTLPAIAVEIPIDEKSASEKTTIKACKQCGKDNVVDAKFCAYCGSPLASAKPATPKPAKAQAAAVKTQTRYQIYIALLVAAAFILIVSGLNYDKNVLNNSLRKGTLNAPQDDAPPTPPAEEPPSMPLTADQATLDQIDQTRKSYEAEKDVAKKALLGVELIERFRKIGRLDLAGNTAAEIASFYPDNASLAIRAANIYDDGKLYDKAIIYYQKALAIVPKNVDARVDMAICYLQSGQPRVAVQEMRQAVTDNPKHQKANLNLGILNAQIGRMDEAKKFWQVVIDIDPTTEAAAKARQLLEQVPATK
jgi:tetratricopeptide (TPR) repeat protein